MSAPTALVVAKAPVAGQAKTRLATNLGYDAAADLAAAALLDTLDVVGSLQWPVVVAMTGDLHAAARGDEIASACEGFEVIGQRGGDFGSRLVAAHTDASSGHGVVQVGMDTPQLTTEQLREAADALADHDAALGPAEDGGWWVLALRAPEQARCLAQVPMSVPDTGVRTRAALEQQGGTVCSLSILRDIDTWDDGRAVAAQAPETRFAIAWRSLDAGTTT